MAHRHHSATDPWICFALLLIATAPVGGCGSLDDDDDPRLGESTIAIVSGTMTNARPEVGQIDGCTATLITPQHFITAASCIAYEANRGAGGRFRIGANTYAIDRMTSFDGEPGRFDIALGRLAGAVPIHIATPAAIATTPPVDGTWVTAVGYGCIDRNPERGAGSKRSSGFNWGWQTTRLCRGDEGGPLFVGNLAANGPIVGINSGHHGAPGDERGVDIFADPVEVKQRIEQTIRDWEDGFEVGIDRPGLDLRNFETASAATCREECTRDSRCRAFSFMPTQRRCWLKKALAEPRYDPRIISGLPLPIGSFDRRGSDIRSHLSPNADACRAECARATDCVAFTYNTATGRCFQKGTIPGASVCAHCRSGSVRGLEYNVDREGNDYTSFGAGSADICQDQCARDERCVAFSYVSSRRRCYLKDAPSPASSENGVTSGVRGGWELDLDLPGSDFRHFAMGDPRPDVCQAACEREPACRAWTLTTEPSAARENRCFLKNAVPVARRRASGVISGFKGTAFF